MKEQLKVILLAFFIITLIFLSIGCSTMINEINYFDILNKVNIIGALNIPIGEIVTIEGVIIDDTYTKAKSDLGKVLLKVQSINGKKLEEEIIIQINIFVWSNINEPEVNDYKKYIGYETGEMRGIPYKAFDYMPQVTTEEFHFTTYFQVCKEL